MLPDGRPFYGGTYYPKVQRYGMPSFTQLMDAVHEAYRNQRENLEQQADNLHQALKRDVLAIGRADDSGLTSCHCWTRRRGALMASVDRDNGGFGVPAEVSRIRSVFEFLLRHHARTERRRSAQIWRHSRCGRWRSGGIYDQIGGGFARYSVDAHWLVPHFEKMLYDNAQLSRLYLHAFQITGDDLLQIRSPWTFTITYLREMTAPRRRILQRHRCRQRGRRGQILRLVH